MTLRHLRGKRPFLVLAVLVVALMLAAAGGWGGGAEVAAGPNKADHNHQHRANDTNMLQNPAPPPPPGVAKVKGQKTVADIPASSLGQLGGVTAGVSATNLSGLNAAVTTGTGVAAGGSKALVLYDTTGPYGWLGELYATGAANLASHFGSWTAKPVTAYTAGEVANYTAVIYLGSTYDEPLPAAFLSDVLTTSKPVVWAYDNIWQVARQNPTAFTARYGWNAANALFDMSTVAAVRYKGTELTRYSANGAGILNPQTAATAFDTTKVTVLATAVRADGTTFPWAVRSGNLTYIGEIPVAYMKEEDRYLAFTDLLFDALAPGTATRHRAMVRLEDLNPESDPAALRAVADYLASQGVPFGFGLSPLFKDPYGYTTGSNCVAGVKCGPAATVSLKDRPELVKAIQYAQSKGGVLVLHGYTHQWDGGINPYNGVTGDDYEFYRVTENADHTLNYVGPIPGDSQKWADGRIVAANKAISDAKLQAPTIFEFPHYSASAADYRAVAARFTTRWERSLYFNGVLSGGTVSYNQIFGQFFPYAVRDVYGTKVLPENLGSIELEQFYQYPTRFPADLINAAQKNLVVRDGVVCFYYHPDFVPISYLQQTVQGIKSAGYTFVSPTSVAP